MTRYTQVTEAGSTTIFYDRSIRLWTAIKVDAEGNQIGNAGYGTCRSDAVADLEDAE